MLATGGGRETFFRRTMPVQKRALFITKKGTFSPLKKIGGAHAPVPTPLRITTYVTYICLGN
jgi:hypothetical protein